MAFLFVLPKTIDMNKYSSKITQIIKNNTGYEALIEGVKVKTYWNLSVGASVEKTDLLNAKKEKFAQLNGLQIRVSLLPLLFKKIK